MPKVAPWRTRRQDKKLLEKKRTEKEAGEEAQGDGDNEDADAKHVSLPTTYPTMYVSLTLYRHFAFCVACAYRPYISLLGPVLCFVGLLMRW